MTDHSRRAGGTRPRTIALAAAFGLAVSVAGGAASADDALDQAPPSVAAEYELSELGPAILAANVRSAEFGTDADGGDVVFATSNGEPATFSVLDRQSGEQLYAQELEGFELGGFIVQDPQGQVYFTARVGNNAGLFHFDPAERQVTELDVDLQNQRVLYDGSLDADGVLYFGTYPNAMVMGYDTTSGELRDYGSITDDAAYVFSLSVVEDEIWAGTGPVPHLFRIDPSTGERTEMHPPEHVMDNTDWFIGIEPREGYVFVRLSPRGSYDMAVYDREQDRWLDEVIEGTFDTPVSDIIEDKAYFLVDDVLTGFDLETETTFSTGFEDSWLWEEMAEAVGTYDFTITDEGDGPVAIGINTDGQIWRYHLDTEQGELLEADVLGSPAGAHSMGVGPDGAVYMGAYLSSGSMSRIDPQSHEIEYLRGPKQGDSIMTHEDLLVVSSYPGAGVHTGSVQGGFDWAQTEHVLQLERGAPYYQDRIFALTSVEDRVAVGSVPDYGQVGGALTLLDPDTGEYDFHRDVVEGQSVVALAYADGIIYGGTSIHGGMDSSPVGSAGEFFRWDVEAAELLSSEVISEDAQIIPRVAIGPDERIWGLTSTGTVFVVDPQSGEVVERIETGLVTTNNWGRSTALYSHDGYLYGNAGDALFRIDPETLEAEIVVESGVRYSAVDGEGQIYIADDIDVFAVTPRAACDETITGDHRGPVSVDEGTTCLVEASVRGPVQVADGAALQMRDSTLRGPLRAEGAERVELSGNEIVGPVQINGSDGRVLVEDNAITGSLACSGNAEEPAGSGNTVRGAVSGQCADLVDGGGER